MWRHIVSFIVLGNTNLGAYAYYSGVTVYLTYSLVIVHHRKLSIPRRFHICGNRSPSEKWRHLGNIQPSHTKSRFACCALTILYIIYGTVDWSIASISDLGTHIPRCFAPRLDILAMDLPTILYILHIALQPNTNLIIINVTHISMFRNYSFNFGRNVT